MLRIKERIENLDANAMADLALAGHEILGFDTVMPEYSVHQESAVLGCDVDWGIEMQCRSLRLSHIPTFLISRFRKIYLKSLL